MIGKTQTHFQLMQCIVQASVPCYDWSIIVADPLHNRSLGEISIDRFQNNNMDWNVRIFNALYDEYVFFIIMIWYIYYDKLIFFVVRYRINSLFKPTNGIQTDAKQYHK